MGTAVYNMVTHPKFLPGVGAYTTKQMSSICSGTSTSSAKNRNDSFNPSLVSSVLPHSKTRGMQMTALLVSTQMLPSIAGKGREKGGEGLEAIVAVTVARRA